MNMKNRNDETKGLRMEGIEPRIHEDHQLHALMTINSKMKS